MEPCKSQLNPLRHCLKIVFISLWHFSCLVSSQKEIEKGDKIKAVCKNQRAYKGDCRSLILCTVHVTASAHLHTQVLIPGEKVCLRKSWKAWSAVPVLHVTKAHQKDDLFTNLAQYCLQETWMVKWEWTFVLALVITWLASLLEIV